MENFFDIEKISPSASDFISRVGSEKSGSIFGACEPLKIALATRFKGKKIYITSDFVRAGKCYEMFSEIYGNKVQKLVPTPDFLEFSKTKNLESEIANSIALSRFASEKAEILILPASALLSYHIAKDSLLKSKTFVKSGDIIEPSELAKKLLLAGYKREELLSSPCSFSIRGDVLDVYPIGADICYRIEFFDREIEGIFELDTTKMKRGREVASLEIFACTNVVLDQEERAVILKKLEKLLERDFEDSIKKEEFVKNINDLMFKLGENSAGYMLDPIFSLCKNKSSILDYFEDATVIIDESKMVYDELQSLEREMTERVSRLQDSGMLLSKTGNFLSLKSIIESMQSKTKIAFQKLVSTNRFFNPKAVLNLRSAPTIRYTHNLSLLAADLKKWDFEGYRNIIFARSKEDAEFICATLEKHNISYPVCKVKALSESDDAILPASFSSGFILPEEKIVVIGTNDILAKKAKVNTLRASRANVFSVPKVGDYVVHSFHGIGKCEGVTKLEGNFGTKDYVVVSYFGGDKLYVPIDQMDMLDKFSGAEAPKKLSKIGGGEFQRVKDRVKSSVKKLAFDLLSLYAEREKKKGHTYSKDTPLQIEFENSFAYAETEDQLKSISEIKADMEEGKVMERLLCGDVGFGKTEVALRAAFKTIIEGKQVAFLAPTTILSEQHYNTARARMDNFGVRVEVLNRFKTLKQTRAILSDLREGKIDLLCGTHRLLSSDVQFKDLGLIILDEEQKFGVEDKEKIKLTYPNVNVLTLSATPIPRTLHMSLSGIRDVSIISTPPSERLPISTYVTEYSASLIKEGIEKERARGGQTFILFNSVEKIYAFAEEVRRLVPEARVIVGHGQMSGRELENIVYQFYHGEADVLVCTTIIENGIDIENANTLIVINSDMFGLSQLYQLRGRVGRGSKMGYAYLTYNPSKVLTEDAYRRLDAISEFTEFGSGFKLAMRDLEIRGSGNILGAEQHGHMEKVGYELYSKLLSEAVSELRGEKVEETAEVQMKIQIDAFIPDNYITKSEDRMIAYKSIAAIKSDEDRQRVIRDIAEVYGAVPKQTVNLIDIAYMKAKAAKLKASAVVSSMNAFEIVFDSKDKIIKSDIIGELIYKFRAMCSLDFTNGSKICFKKLKSAEENFSLLKEFLNEV